MTMTMQKPEICCTCSIWHPFKDDVENGVCKMTKISSAFDEGCGKWKDCDSENRQCAAILGYD